MSIADPISKTARWIAAARARESVRADRLFEDPFAEELAGSEGFALMERIELASASLRRGREDNPYLAIRTRFIDDFLLETLSTGALRQVVVVAAGLDTRAFRLPGLKGSTAIEIDRPEVLHAKQRVLDSLGAKPVCERQVLGIDVEAPWERAFGELGFDRALPSIWIIEGLLAYLEEDSARAVAAKSAALASAGSRLVADLPGRGFLESPRMQPHLQALAAEQAPWKFGTDEPEAWFAAQGWEARAYRPGDEGADYGRWPYPVFARGTPGFPQSFIITAERR